MQTGTVTANALTQTSDWILKTSSTARCLFRLHWQLDPQIERHKKPAANEGSIRHWQMKGARVTHIRGNHPTCSNTRKKKHASKPEDTSPARRAAPLSLRRCRSYRNSTSRPWERRRTWPPPPPRALYCDRRKRTAKRRQRHRRNKAARPSSERTLVCVFGVVGTSCCGVDTPTFATKVPIKTEDRCPKFWSAKISVGDRNTSKVYYRLQAAGPCGQNSDTTVTEVLQTVIHLETSSHAAIQK